MVGEVSLDDDDDNVWAFMVRVSSLNDGVLFDIFSVVKKTSVMSGLHWKHLHEKNWKKYAKEEKNSARTIVQSLQTGSNHHT